MHAIRLHEFGPPNLVLEELPDLVPAAREDRRALGKVVLLTADG